MKRKGVKIKGVLMEGGDSQEMLPLKSGGGLGGEPDLSRNLYKRDSDFWNMRLTALHGHLHGGPVSNLEK